jgi:hypothetical protein
MQLQDRITLTNQRTPFHMPRSTNKIYSHLQTELHVSPKRTLAVAAKLA